MSHIEKLSDIAFAKAFRSLREKILRDPIKNFIEAPTLINFTPTPAQRVALKCYFGQVLDPVTKHEIYQETLDEFGDFDLTTVWMTETQLYELMTGFAYDSADLSTAKNRINLIIGRRGGKSTIAAIISIFSMIKVNWKPYLKKTPVATVLVLSHSVEFSEEILDIIREMVEASPILNRLRNKKKKNTTKIFHMSVPFLKDGDVIEHSQVRVKVGAASKKTTRGSAVCTFLGDEIAYWSLAENAAESDVEILRAVRPSLMQFGEHGTIIKLSSPGIKQGILYEEWTRREELKKDYFQFKAPSWVWNTIVPKEEHRKEWRLDPDGFNTEIRAEFVDSISNFITPEYVDLCTLKGVFFQPPSDDSKTIYSAAIDAAFKGDRFAFSVVGYNEKRVTQYVLKYWQGSKKKPVQVSDVATFIRTVTKEYGLNEVTADQYSFQPLRELFLQYGVNLVENTFTLPYKRKIYFNLKRLIHSTQIDLLDDAIQTKEIKQLQVEQTTTGQIRIGHPPGGTDDCMPGDTLIKTDSGYRKLSDIKEGDLVYTHLGRLRPVKKTFVKEYDTDLYTMDAYGQAKIQLTGNHPLYANINDYTGCYRSGDDKKPTGRKQGWKTPSEWKLGYKASGLAEFENPSGQEYLIKDETSRAGEIDVSTSDFGLLLGYFIGDGWAVRREKSIGSMRYKCSLAFNRLDTHMIYKFTKLLNKYKIKCYLTEKRGAAALMFHSKLLWSVFVDCYDESRQKKLPGIVYTHKINTLKLIQGWLLADGCRTKQYKKPHGGAGTAPHWVGCTTSKRLALELNDVAWNLGLFSSLSERICHRYGKRCKDQYWLAFRRNRTEGCLQRHGVYKTSKCRVSKEPYKGLLYNLHVEDDESYVANGVIVHNCSDATAVAAYKAMEKAGVVEVVNGGGDVVIYNNDYGVRTDIQGRAFSAPPVDLLHAYQGFAGVVDNSSEYVKDPKTGKLRRKSELDEEEGTSGEGNFVF